MTPGINVHQLDVMVESEWQFRGAGPAWRPRGRYVGETPFDPFPAYPHDLAVVQHAVAFATERIPPRWDIDLYVADREETSRSNGHSNVIEAYNEGEPPTELIVLSGKRIPPHPAMTRYLVAHEYGHHVEWMINAARGVKNLHDEALAAEYAELRGLPADSLHHGNGGRWHDSVHEILACDFRLLVARVEYRYWPHPGIPHPCDGGQLENRLTDWWVAQRDLLAQTQPSGAAS